MSLKFTIMVRFRNSSLEVIIRVSVKVKRLIVIVKELLKREDELVIDGFL